MLNANNMDYYLEVLKKYAVFSGRARRKEYWLFFFFNFLAGLTFGFFGGVIGAALKTDVFFMAGVLFELYTLAVEIPVLAVSVRRLHDTGRSGWWLLINFLPVIGWIIFLVFVLQDSQKGANKYGPNPKASD